MNRFKNIGLILCGLVLGLALSSPAARAVESLKATLSTNRILVDGKEVRLTAYNINGSNYVMLRDVGRAVGFNVYWNGGTRCVQVESDKPYTGEAPAKAENTKSKEQPVQTDVAAAKQDSKRKLLPSNSGCAEQPCLGRYTTHPILSAPFSWC